MSASAPASTRDAVRSLLLERGEEDAGALADAVGISVQAMRRHLRSLADRGLVCASSIASGPGRPSNRWCLTAAGNYQALRFDKRNFSSGVSLCRGGPVSCV